MTKLLVALLLILGAHFAMTYNVPARTGDAWAGWPFALDDVAPGGGRPRDVCARGRRMLAGLAALGFVMATLSAFALWVPATWWRALTISAAAGSLVLLMRFLRVDTLPAIGVDLGAIAIAVTGCADI